MYEVGELRREDFVIGTATEVRSTAQRGGRVVDRRIR